MSVSTSNKLNGQNTIQFSDGNLVQILLPSFTITNNALSVSFWIYLNNASASTPIFLFAPNSGSSGNNMLALWAYNSGAILTACFDNNSNNNGSIIGIFSYNTWHHICMIISPNKFYYYVDNVAILNTTTSYIPPSNFTYNDNQIGAAPYRVTDTLNYGNYNIANFRVYNCALTPDEINKLYILQI